MHCNTVTCIHLLSASCPLLWDLDYEFLKPMQSFPAFPFNSLSLPCICLLYSGESRHLTCYRFPSIALQCDVFKKLLTAFRYRHLHSKFTSSAPARTGAVSSPHCGQFGITAPRLSGAL